MDQYQALLQAETTYVRFINYQAYADESTDPEVYKKRYAGLAQAGPSQANSGYANLGLGIDSNTTMTRGLQ